MLIEKHGRSGRKYKLQEIKPVTDYRVSTSKDMTKDYKVNKISWDKLDKVVKSKYNYSAGEFKDGYRNKANFIDGSNLVILDIDDGWSIEEAKKFLGEKGLRAMIATTKSHRKVKDKKGVCDRFRVILPTKTEFKGTAEEFSFMMAEIFKYFEGKPDAAAKDASRFYYGFEGSEVTYLEGEPFDIDQFDREKKVKKQERKSRIVNVQSNDLENMRNYFLRKTSEGNRNSNLRRYYVWLKENDYEAKREVELVNNSLQVPLHQPEVDVICRD